MPTVKRYRLRGGKRRKTKKMICSPGKKDNKFTCYSNESLHKLKKMWNARHPDAPILEKKPKKIWHTLKKNMDKVCSSEHCWLKQKFSKNKITAELAKYTFAPFAPAAWNKNPNEWLSSVEIEEVMKQHETRMKNFAFIGPSPIDFDKRFIYGECVWNELCNFNLKSLISKGKNKIGMIFNLDPHYKEGSHWFSTFVDLRKKYVFYIDSTGDSMPKEIRELVNRIIKQAADIGITLTLYENKKEHQYKDSECGMYSLFINIQLLYGKKTPKWLMNNRIADKDMMRLRKKYFNHEE
jgi:hypothetical protein